MEKYVEAKIAEAELEENSDYVDLFASSVSSYRETVDKRKETWRDNMPNLNPIMTVTEPTAYTSELITVPYYAPVDIVPVSNAQLCGLSSTLMHGAEVLPMIPKSLTQIAASTITLQNIGECGCTQHTGKSVG